jgi:hypothetical protein
MHVWNPSRLSSYSSIPLKDQGGGLQPVSYMARKLNQAERGNTYFAYDLEAFTVCERVKHWRYYIESCSKFLVVTDHVTLRHLLKQPNNIFNKRQTRYLWDLQPFLGTITLAYCKGALNEADTLSSESILCSSCRNSIILGWRGSAIHGFRTEFSAGITRCAV